jgi:hypothetical protein
MAFGLSATSFFSEGFFLAAFLAAGLAIFLVAGMAGVEACLGFSVKWLQPLGGLFPKGDFYVDRVGGFCLFQAMQPQKEERVNPLLSKVLFVFLILVVFLATLPGFPGTYFSDDWFLFKSVKNMNHWSDYFKADAFGYFRPVKNMIFKLFNVLVPEGEGLPPDQAWKPHLFTFFCYLLGLFGIKAFSSRLFNTPGFETKGVSSWVSVLLVLFFWALSASNASTALWLCSFNLPLCVAAVCMAMRSALVQKDTWLASWPVMLWSVLSMFFYETGVAVIALVALFEWVRGFDWKNPKLYTRLGSLGLLFVAFMIIRSFSEAKLVSNNPAWAHGTKAYQIMLSAPWAFMRQSFMWLWPWGNLQIICSYKWGVTATFFELLLGWAYLGSWLALVVFLRKRAPLASFGLGWFFVAIFPCLNLVPVFASPYADYYTVLPGVGLALVSVDLVSRLILRVGLHPSGGFSTACRVALVLFLGLRLAVAVEYGKVCSIFAVPANYFAYVLNNYRTSWNNDVGLSRHNYAIQDFAKSKYHAERVVASGEDQANGYIQLARLALLEEDHAAVIRNMEASLTAYAPWATRDISSFQCKTLLTYYCKKDGPFYNPERAMFICGFGRNQFGGDWHGWIVEMYVRLLADAGKKDEALELLEKGLIYYPHSSYMASVKKELLDGSYKPSGGYTEMPPKLEYIPGPGVPPLPVN